MKKRILHILLGITVFTYVFTGCSHQGTADEITVYGQVTKIDGEHITVALAQRDNIQDDNKEDDSDLSEKEAEPSGESYYTITLTGEEQVITVTDKTAVQETEGESAVIDDIEAGNIVTAVIEGAETKSVIIQQDATSVKEVKWESDAKEKKDKTMGSIELTGALLVDSKSENSDNETISSSKENESVVLVRNNGTLSMKKGKLTKAGDTSSIEESDFYGVNAAFVTTAGSESSISDSEVMSASLGSNAIFATGDDALIHVDSVKINTSGDDSRGVEATHGGTIDARDLDITTTGDDSAPIATSKDGGTVTITGGTVSSSGVNSPCIYSAGIIKAEGVEGSAVASQILVIEGNNAISLNKCDLSSAGENAILLSQSTSQDAEEGTTKFKAVDSKLTSNSEGAMFRIINTKADATLESTELIHRGNVLADISGDSAKSKSTAQDTEGTLSLTARNQKLEGDILCDEHSRANIKLIENSLLKSTVNGENKGKSVEISLDKDSKWELTGDSYVNIFKNEDETCSNIESKGHMIYYDNSNSANSWLNGKTVTLSGGGKLVPR